MPPPPRWPQQAWSWVTLSRNFQLPRPKGPQQSQARGAEAAAHAQGPRERCRPGAVPRGSPQAPWAHAGPTCHLRNPQLAPSGANSQETFRDVPTSEKSGSTQPGLQLHVGGGGSHCLAGPPSCLLSGWCPPMAPSPRSDCPPHSRSSHRVGVCSSAPHGEHAAGTPQTPLNATGVLNRSAHEMPNVTAEAERGQRPHELPRSPTLSTNVAT